MNLGPFFTVKHSKLSNHPLYGRFSAKELLQGPLLPLEGYWHLDDKKWLQKW